MVMGCNLILQQFFVHTIFLTFNRVEVCSQHVLRVSTNLMTMLNGLGEVYLEAYWARPIDFLLVKKP